MALIETGDDISSIKLIYIFNLVGSLIYPMLVMGALVAYEKKRQSSRLATIALSVSNKWFLYQPHITDGFLGTFISGQFIRFSRDGDLDNLEYHPQR